MKILFVGKLYLYKVFGQKNFKEDSLASRRRILGLARGLRKHGVDVDILSPMTSYPKKDFFCSTIKENYESLDIYYPGFVNIKFLNYISLTFSTLKLMWDLYNEKQYDAIIFYNPVLYRGYPAIIVGKLKKIPIIMDYEDLVDSEYTSQKWVRWFFGIIERHIVRLIDNFILVTENFKDRIKKGSKYITIRSGINKEDFINFYSLKRNQINTNIILYSGKLDRIRGIDLLIESTKFIKTKNYKIVIVGKGQLTNYVIEMARKNQYVEYKGFVNENEYYDLLQKATVLVNVQRTGHKFSRYCFPSKLYEYMASGKFVISTDISDIREHFKNQIFILKEDNPETLAQTIDYILNNKENLKHIPQKAQKYIIENENWEQQALKVLQFLNSLKILQK